MFVLLKLTDFGDRRTMALEDLALLLMVSYF
jgi:hypothetical protein